jgi:GNAT superfamily N-acetyltransferase
VTAHGYGNFDDPNAHVPRELRVAEWNVCLQGATNHPPPGDQRELSPASSDARGNRDDAWLDPMSEPAKIRAFFIDPVHARRGLGRAILERSEADAARAGFSAFELMATLPGMRLYEKCGYVPQTPIRHPLPPFAP